MGIPAVVPEGDLYMAAGVLSHIQTADFWLRQRTFGNGWWRLDGFWNRPCDAR